MIRKLRSGEYRLYSRKRNPATGKRRNLGTFKTRSAAEKLAAIAIQPGEPWSVIEVDGEARPAAVIDFAAYRAKRRARHQKS